MLRLVFGDVGVSASGFINLFRTLPKPVRVLFYVKAWFRAGNYDRFIGYNSLLYHCLSLRGRHS